MKTFILDCLKGDNGIGEMRYCKNVYFGFANSERQITSMTVCRGWQMEAVFASIHNADGKIPHTLSKKNNGCINFDNLELLIGCSLNQGSTFFIDKRIGAVIDFLNQIETKLKFKKSKFVRASNIKDGTIYLMKGDGKWMSSPYLISTLTFLIRTVALFYHEEGSSYIKSLANFLKAAKFADMISVYGDFKYSANNFFDKNGVSHGIGIGDYEDFEASYRFLCFVLRHGVEPFFSKEIKANFPKSVLGKLAHDYGMAALSNPDYAGYFDNFNLYDLKTVQYAHRFDFNNAKVNEWKKKNIKNKVKICVVK